MTQEISTACRHFCTAIIAATAGLALHLRLLFMAALINTVVLSLQVGIFGIVHPEVLAAFDVEHPVSALELNIEPFCFDTSLKSLMHEMHGWNLLH